MISAVICWIFYGDIKWFLVLAVVYMKMGSSHPQFSGAKPPVDSGGRWLSCQKTWGAPGGGLRLRMQ